MAKFILRNLIFVAVGIAPTALGGYTLADYQWWVAVLTLDTCVWIGYSTFED